MVLPNFSKSVLIPVIVQDFVTKRVLMLGYMNEEAYRLTLDLGEVHYFSRSRGRIWKKGERSGYVQRVRRIFFDCDEDTLLVMIDQLGGASCHNGYVSCFYRELGLDGSGLSLVEERFFDPAEVYKDE